MGETVTRKSMMRVLLVVATAASLWSLALVWLNRGTWVGDPEWAFGPPISALAFAVVGFIVVRSRSENPVGWIMLVLSAAMALMTWGFEYALRGYTGFQLPIADAGAYVSHFANKLVTGSLAALALLFPSGRLGTRLWRVMFGLVVVGTVAIMGLGLFEGTTAARMVDVRGAHRELSLAPPLITGVDADDVVNLAALLGLLLIFLPLGMAILRLVVEFVRGPAIERQQLKWVVYVLAVGFGLMGMAQVPGLALSRLNQIGGLIILVGVPVVMGIAITRYRLYEIDRIVSRTVTYAAVVGLLALVFAVGVVLVPNLVPGLEDDAVLVAMSTLASAALFNPVRKRLQRAVDRRFNRSRYNAERVVEDFTDTLRDRVDPDSVADGWKGVVSEALEPNGIAIWVRDGVTVPERPRPRTARS